MHVSVQTMNRTSYPSFSSLLLSSLELSDTQVYEPYIRALLLSDTHVYDMSLKYEPSPGLCGRHADARLGANNQSYLLSFFFLIYYSPASS